MLQIPEGAVFEPMAIETDAVRDPLARAPFVPEPSAPILLLGDSFTRVFSDPSLGLGEHAGLAEQLAAELRTAVDVIAIAGGSALAVREAVARRGLDGKELVVWQLSMRDLAGDPSLWRTVTLGSERAASVPDDVLRVRAEVTKVSRVPEEFDYAFCLAVYEYRVLEALEGPVPEGPLSVAHVAIENHADVAGSRFEVGDVHVLRLERVEHHHDLEQTSWIDDTRTLAPIWFATEYRAR
jgi:alginate O-acetyltransferase complex protein AlgJ